MIEYLTRIVEVPVWGFLAVYGLCLVGAYWLGKDITRRKAQIRIEEARHEIYSDGWDAGHGFLERINQAKDEKVSAVKVLSRTKPFDWENEGTL